MSKILMIDNYDSFTYNLVQYFRELGKEVLVHRNDQLSLEAIEALSPDYLVISPGPCTPDQAGISIPSITHFSGKIPILGVCLGHQAIGQAFGAKVIRARQVMHGKTSLVWHHGKGVFAGLENPLEVTRYHSLIIDATTLPECLEVTCWTQTPEGKKDEIMGIRHKTLAIEGVQFHPESILTRQGHELLDNFIRRTLAVA
ncbi:anthranilate synthase component II [Nitrincola alkalilacustris]|uniref:anthranilate synthase component II n=1 Tax=Nitrincola alkalilacustris TaxID=1571224 RepID=UPI00124CCA64|nr:aminodeoxychorismate/anthranilate synthase component II [Nitrincola alkalilacustris]